MKPFKIFTIAFLMLFFLLFLNEAAMAQCAMCKGAIAEKVSDGESNFGEGLNKGILYLMAFPYMIFGAIAFFWYKESKKGSDKSSNILDNLKRKFRA
jgi:hypothetical protein